jgi:hypothetical protein
MTRHLVGINTEHLLGSVGWVLLIAVIALSDRGYGPQTTFATRLSGRIARGAINVIAAVGWLVDRLPEPAARPSQPRAGTPTALGVRA